MSAIALPPKTRSTIRRHGLEVAWIALACANYSAGLLSENWERIPFHIAWIVLTAAYGLLVLREDRVLLAVFVFGALGAGLMLLDALHVVRLWSNPYGLPPVLALMSLVIVWNARRHNDALRRVHGLAEERRSLLENQERFVHDASHELRTPLTIARGHLELLRSRSSGDHDLNVALEEMSRLDGIIERLLLLAAAGRPDFLAPVDVDVESYLEDVFVRWVDIAPRAWRLGPLPRGRLSIDPDRVRTALDALLENAVKHTEERDAIELRARLEEDRIHIEVVDEGSGVPSDALGRIFERFGRADPARGRSAGGVGLGLAIVDAIAKAHSGRCTVRSDPGGSVFALELPGFSSAEADAFEIWQAPALRSVTPLG